MDDPNPARWLSDPTGRNSYRYWNGSEWTSQVSNDGKGSLDPLPNAQKNNSTDTLIQSESIPEIFNLYLALVEFINRELEKENTNLNNIQKNDLDDTDEYQDIYATIFTTAKNYITSNAYKNIQNNTEIFNLLISRINTLSAVKLEAYCDGYSFGKSKAQDPDSFNEDTLKKNGIIWDALDDMIANDEITNFQNIAIASIQKRANHILEIPELCSAIVELYLYAIKLIDDEIWSTKQWPKEMRGYPETYSGFVNTLAPNIFRICEQAIRYHLPYTHQLETKAELQMISHMLPTSISDKIVSNIEKNELNSYKKQNIFEKLRKNNSNDWLNSINELPNCSETRCIEILDWYRNSPTKKIITKAAISKSFNKNINYMLTLYAYLATHKIKELTPAMEVKLSKTIPISEQKRFIKLASKNLLISDQLLTHLLNLKIETEQEHSPISGLANTIIEIPIAKPPSPPIFPNSQISKTTATNIRRPAPKQKHRILDLNEDKINQANLEHVQAVSKIDNYLGLIELEQSDNVQALTDIDRISLAQLIATESTQVVAIALTNEDQKAFLKLLVKNDFNVSITTAEQFAKENSKILGSLIQSINQKFYEAIEEPLISKGEEYIAVEYEHHKLIKELLDDKDKS